MARDTLSAQCSKKGQTPVVWATAYDAWGASILDGKVDAILVGDSLGMVVQGHENTLPVTLDEVIYHTKMVARGSKKSFLIADLPFLSYQVSTEEALFSAGRILKESGAQAVKLEGGIRCIPTIKAMVEAGIPVCGHLGMTPQSVHAFGGFGKQAKADDEAKKLIEEAEAISKAGVFAMVLENIPHELAKLVTSSVDCLTIGIGAGGSTDGQVQVFHDLFGLFPDFSPRHAVAYGAMGKEMQDAIDAYAKDVRDKNFISK